MVRLDIQIYFFTMLKRDLSGVYDLFHYGQVASFTLTTLWLNTFLAQSRPTVTSGQTIIPVYPLVSWGLLRRVCPPAQGKHHNESSGKVCHGLTLE